MFDGPTPEMKKNILQKQNLGNDSVPMNNLDVLVRAFKRSMSSGRYISTRGTYIKLYAGGKSVWRAKLLTLRLDKFIWVERTG